MFVGSTVGNFVPALWGAGSLSFSGVFCSAIGAIIGIYIGFKISR
ncbi:MAG: hypothetical protein JWN89_480 [Parcubacteria group bacterium]|nr:hypothetical protein [Parcubacteria group bacterium]